MTIGSFFRIITGAGLSGTDNSDGTNTFAVNVDGSTIEINSDALRVKDGGITEAKLGLTDVTTANASTSAHGFLKKLSNAAGEFMNGVGSWVALNTVAVTSLKKTGGSALVGDVEFDEGANVTITPSGQKLIIAATVVGSGAVDSIAVQGDTPMVGDIQIAGAGGITVTQDDVDTVTVTGSGGGIDGWVDDAANTWTYATAATFTVTGDRTAVFQKGTKLRFTQTTVKYGVVASSSHAGGTTTVTIMVNTDYVLANAAISVNSYSYTENPQGYPDWFNYTPTVSGISGSPTIDYAKFSVRGRTVTINFGFTATSTASTMTATIPVNANTTSFTVTPCLIENNSALLAAAGRVDTATGTALRFGITCSSAGGFATSNLKGAYGMISYEMA